MDIERSGAPGDSHGPVSASMPGYEGEATTGTSAVHYGVLECTQYTQMLGRIHAVGLNPRVQEVPKASLRQILFKIRNRYSPN